MSPARMMSPSCCPLEYFFIRLYWEAYRDLPASSERFNPCFQLQGLSIISKSWNLPKKNKALGVRSADNMRPGESWMETFCLHGAPLSRTGFLVLIRGAWISASPSRSGPGWITVGCCRNRKIGL